MNPVLRWRPGCKQKEGFKVKQRFWSLVSATALLVALTIPMAHLAAAQSVKTGGMLTVGLDGEIDTIDPLKSVTIVGFQVYSQIYEALVTATPALDGVVPRLATSWDVSADGLTYTFHLRPGIKFHNGKDFKAEDVKFTFDRVLNKDFGSPRAANFSVVDQINVVDDATIQFVLKTAYAPLLDQLDGVFIEPNLPDNDFSKTPIGTGPYTFVEW